MVDGSTIVLRHNFIKTAVIFYSTNPQSIIKG